MMRIVAFLLLVGVVLGAAATPKTPLAWIREGNAAFAREDFGGAAEAYTQAETRIEDPGLAAFNKATALYRLGRFREAEQHFREAAEDAEGLRQARVRFGLGNCALRLSRGLQRAWLQEATVHYQACLEHPAADADLIEAARHNLELARGLLQKAEVGKDAVDSHDEERDSERDPGENRSESGADAAVNATPATPDPKGKLEYLADQRPQPGQQPRATSQLPPGKGNLPPLPDEDQLVPLSREEAAALLEQAVGRIRRDQIDYHRRPQPRLPAHVKDW